MKRHDDDRIHFPSFQFNAYTEWLINEMERFKKFDPTINSSCQNTYRGCIKFGEIIGKGGGSSVIESQFFSKNCNNTLFEFFPEYSFVIKLCNSELLGQLSCKHLSNEIRNILKYSLLRAYNICINFLFCIGYGVNCCLLVPSEEKHKSPEDLTNFKLMNQLGYDVEDYLDAQKNGEGCDTFIFMNKINGKSLDKISSNYILNERQTFEYVYALLCSVVFFKFIPADIHDDNLMVNKTKKRMIVKIEDKYIFFKNTTSIVLIDYQTEHDRIDLKWGDLYLKKRFHPKYSANLEKVFKSNLSALEKIYKLPEIFENCICKNINKIQSNNTEIV